MRERIKGAIAETNIFIGRINSLDAKSSGFYLGSVAWPPDTMSNMSSEPKCREIFAGVMDAPGELRPVRFNNQLPARWGRPGRIW